MWVTNGSGAIAVDIVAAFFKHHQVKFKSGSVEGELSRQKEISNTPLLYISTLLNGHLLGYETEGASVEVFSQIPSGNQPLE